MADVEKRESGGPRRPSFPNPRPSRPDKPFNAEKEPEKPVDLDDVLVNEIGQFGWFQLRNVILVSIPIIMSAFMSEYIFSAAAVPHRCQISECEGTNPSFEASWLLNAIPASGGGVDSCRRYAPSGNATSAATCPPSLFNQNQLQDCDAFVHGKTNSVVYDFGLECQEWLRALAGTLSSVGTLLVLPVTGYVSDKYGRRVALVISVFNLALFGLIRAFSVNYPMYLALQLLQTTLGAGTFSTCYIFATELVGPKYRVLAGSLCSSMFAVGMVVLGGVAWLVQPWRTLIIVLHVPCFLIIAYYWILTESVRWLLSKQKYEEARIVLQKVAETNGKAISDKSLDALTNPPAQASEKVEEDQNRPGLVKAILSSKVLTRRVCTTPIWWITNTFVYYGLSINSVGLSGNMYINFIIVCAVEIPGFFCAAFILNKIGRKMTLTGGYFFCAACNFAFVFISSDLETLRLVFFLLGKLSIALVMTSVYLYTSELYPTEYRHSLLGFSSMVGRIGSITAPLTPALMVYWDGIPNTMFGVMALLSCVLALTQPETLGTVMPNTLEEAEALGQPSSLRSDGNTPDGN